LSEAGAAGGIFCLLFSAVGRIGAKRKSRTPKDKLCELKVKAFAA